MTVAGRTVRPERGSATRELILATAERLFAENGMHAVSNRQIGEAAGQGNTGAVSYHFGTKADLVRAIARKHAEQMEHLRVYMMADVTGSAGLRDWVACLVRPFTEHLAASKGPTWYARFLIQVESDPVLHDIMIEELLASPSLRPLLDRLNGAVPDLPAVVRAQRWEMARHLVQQMCADQERALARETRQVTGFPASWEALTTNLVDVIVALWQAPATTHPSTVERKTDEG